MAAGTRMKVIARNMMWLMLSQIATWAVSMVLLIIVPQRLGDVDFGRISLAVAFVSFFGLVAGLGTSTFIVKTTARDPSRMGVYVFNALAMNVLLVTVLSAVAVGTAHVLGYPYETIVIIGVSCLGMAFVTFNSTLVAGLQGEQRMGKPAAWAVVQQYVSCGIALAVLAEHKGVIAFVLAQNCTYVIPLVANGIQLWPRLREDAHIDLHLWKGITLGGLPFLLWNGILLIYGSIDTPMLAAMAGNATVGWYALAYRWVGVPTFLASIVVTAVLPSLSAHGAEISPFFINLANRALRLVFIIGAPIAAGIALVANDVVALLHYPSSFSHAVPLMRILALHIPIVGVDMVLGIVLIASDRQKQWVIVGCLAAVLNPLLNLVAIPMSIRMFGNGAIGASIITVATELFMMAGAIYLRPRGVLDKATASFLLRCALASLPMIPAVLAFDSAWLPVKIAVGAILYALASLALRTVSVRELHRSGLQFLDAVRLRSISSTP
jgi:O-antigen/teichoic acid export membrane protein